MPTMYVFATGDNKNTVKTQLNTNFGIAGVIDGTINPATIGTANAGGSVAGTLGTVCALIGHVHKGVGELVAGSNITLSGTVGTVTIHSSGTLGGLEAFTLVTVNAEAGLAASRQLAVGTGIAKTDGGAGSTVTLTADYLGSAGTFGTSAQAARGDHTHPDLLSRSGGTITGNIVVDSAITIDGVDISGHVTSALDHGAGGGKVIGIKPSAGGDQNIFHPTATGTAGAALGNEGTSEYSARRDHEHASGGGVATHRATHETGGTDLVRFANLERSGADSTTHDNYTSAPHISQAEKDLFSKPPGWNMLGLPDFETTESNLSSVWVKNTSGVGTAAVRDTTTVKSGTASAKLVLGALGTATDYSEVAQPATGRFPVNTGYLYGVDTWVKSSGGTETFSIIVESYNSGGTSIGTPSITSAVTNAVIPNSWTQKTGYTYGTGTAAGQFPTNTVEFVPRFRFSETGGAGTLNLDDVRIWKVPVETRKDQSVPEPGGGIWQEVTGTANFGTAAASGGLGVWDATKKWNTIRFTNSGGATTATIDGYIQRKAPYDYVANGTMNFNILTGQGGTFVLVEILDTQGGTVPGGSYPITSNGSVWTNVTVTPTGGTFDTGKNITYHVRAIATSATTGTVSLGPVVWSRTARVDK